MRRYIVKQASDQGMAMLAPGSEKIENKNFFLETDRKLGAGLRQMSEIGWKKLRTDVH